MKKATTPITTQTVSPTETGTQTAVTVSVTEHLYRVDHGTGRGRHRQARLTPAGPPTPRTEPSPEAGHNEDDSDNILAEPSSPPRSTGLCVREEVQASGDVALRLHGLLNGYTAMPFRDVAFTVLGRRPARLLLDLTEIESISLQGLSALVAVSRVARLLKRECIVTASPALCLVIEKMRLRHLKLSSPSTRENAP